MLDKNSDKSRLKEMELIVNGFVIDIHFDNRTRRKMEDRGHSRSGPSARSTNITELLKMCPVPEEFAWLRKEALSVGDTWLTEISPFDDNGDGRDQLEAEFEGAKKETTVWTPLGKEGIWANHERGIFFTQVPLVSMSLTRPCPGGMDVDVPDSIPHAASACNAYPAGVNVDQMLG